MNNGFRVTWLLVLVAGCLSVRVCLAQVTPPPPDLPPAAEIRKQIEAVDKQLDDLTAQKEALEKKAQEAERLADRRQHLTDLRNESRDRMRDDDNEMTEIGAREPTELTAEKLLRDARIKRLRECRTLNEQILAIEDAAQLEQAEKLRERREELYVDWDMLAGPKLQAAANLAGMHRQVKEDGTQAQRDFRERYQKLVEEDGPARQQEMELIKARQAREKAMGELINKFWGN